MAVSSPAPTDMPRFTIRQAVEYALAHQPQFAAARARLESARADARVPRAEWAPQLGVVAELVGSTANNSTTTFISNRVVDIPRIGATASNTTSFRPYASSLVAFGLRQQLFDFGRVAAETAAEEALVAVERARLGQTHLDLVQAVSRAYYAVAASHSVLEQSEQAYRRAEAHRDFAQALVQQGLRSPIELTRANADLSRFDVARIRAIGGLRLARNVFAATLGTPEAEVEIVAEPEADRLLVGEETAEQRALAADPALKAAEENVRAQGARAHATAAQMRPQVFLSASISGRAGGAPTTGGDVAPYKGFLSVVPNYDVGVVLSWPVFDPTIWARARAQRVRENVAREEFGAQRLRTVQAVREAYERVRLAEVTLGALDRAAEAARANYAQAEARFKNGFGTSTELADAETLRTEAELEAVVGRFQLSTARAALARAMAEEPSWN